MKTSVPTSNIELPRHCPTSLCPFTAKYLEIAFVYFIHFFFFTSDPQTTTCLSFMKMFLPHGKKMDFVIKAKGYMIARKGMLTNFSLPELSILVFPHSWRSSYVTAECFQSPFLGSFPVPSLYISLFFVVLS